MKTLILLVAISLQVLFAGLAHANSVPTYVITNARINVIGPVESCGETTCMNYTFFSGPNVLASGVGGSGCGICGPFAGGSLVDVSNGSTFEFDQWSGQIASFESFLPGTLQITAARMVFLPIGGPRPSVVTFTVPVQFSGQFSPCATTGETSCIAPPFANLTLDRKGFARVRFDYSNHSYIFAGVTYATVPEPGTIILMATGVLALTIKRR